MWFQQWVLVVLKERTVCVALGHDMHFSLVERKRGNKVFAQERLHYMFLATLSTCLVFMIHHQTAVVEVSKFR